MEIVERRMLLSGSMLHADHDHAEHGELVEQTLNVDGRDLTVLPPVEPRDEATGGVGAAAAATPFPLADTFRLHSNPGASKVIYLDFDGHTTSGTWWNSSFNDGQDIVTPAYTTDGSSAFNSSELALVQEIWQRVAEDFLPFNVNVTTEDPGVDALRKTSSSDTQWGVRIVIGGSSSWFGSAGGVAYVGTFSINHDLPAFVFTANNQQPGFVAEAASHETGHTLGLGHDGTTTQEYYSGHGSGATQWAPIMGVGYYKSVTQWSRGEYNGANNTEDDLAIITNASNGFGYRADDHSAGFSFNDPTPLDVSAAGTSVSGVGIIERTADYDHFRFDHGGGALDLRVDNSSRGANLDVRALLYEWSGSSWAYRAGDNSSTSLDARITGDYPAGTYMLRIDGVGALDPATNGYSDYASLGHYTVTGTVTALDTAAPVVASSNFEFETRQAINFTFSEDVLLSLNLTDLVVTNHTTGQVIPAGRFKLNATGDAGAPTSASWEYDIAQYGVLPDGNYTATLPAGSVEDAAGNTLASSASRAFFVFAGDTNRDRKVDFTDFLRVRSNFGKSSGALFSEGDFTYDGKVDFADFLVLRSKFGGSLAAPSSGSLFSDGAIDDDNDLLA